MAKAKKTTKKRRKSELLLKKIAVEIKKWKTILYLQQWLIRVELDDLSNIGEEDGTKYLAITQIIVPYREVTMIFDVNIPRERIEEVVIHELIHLIIHPIPDKINHLLADRITIEEKNILHDIEETSVSDITRIITTRIQASSFEKKKKRKKKKKMSNNKGGEKNEKKH